jgi:hypothetical protein
VFPGDAKKVCNVDRCLAQEACPVNMKKAVHFLAHLFDNRQPDPK